MYAASEKHHLASPQAAQWIIPLERIYLSRIWRCSESRGIRATPSPRLLVCRLSGCLTGGLYVPVESHLVSIHVPSVVRSDYVGVVQFSLRHPCARSLKDVH